MKIEDAVIFEDDDYVAINKPSGLLVIPDRFDASKDNLYALLNQKYGKIWIIHRLDKDTSGVVVFAKNPEAHRDLSMKWEEKCVSKVYDALVLGELEKGSGTINKYIAPLKKKKGVMTIVKSGGKKSITDYKVTEKYRGYTSVELEPRTGRTHQIRVHMAYIGHPVAGDVLYNREEAMGGVQSGVRSPASAKAAAGRPGSGIKNKEKSQISNLKSQIEFPRLMLHASKLRFAHYKTGEPVELTAAVPEDMGKVILKFKIEGLIIG